MRVVARIFIVFVMCCLLYPAIVWSLYVFAPSKNATLTGVDALIVLGCPTDPDGSPSVEQRERVMEAVREFKKGVSNHIIMTGAAAHNRFVEADSMARLAEANGVPATALVEESQAQNTVENIYYSNEIMKANGWHSTEVISTAYHLPRTALILHHYPQLKWKTRGVPWPAEYGLRRRASVEWREAQGCLMIRLLGFNASKYLPN